MYHWKLWYSSGEARTGAGVPLAVEGLDAGVADGGCESASAWSSLN